MRYRAFADTGWELSVIGFGGVPLSFGERPSERDAIAVLHLAFDLGINFVDTADAYCRDGSEVGHNERLIAKALRELPAGRRAEIRVFTKGGYTRPGGGWAPNGRPHHLRSACEASLRSLGVEQIDLYQYHTIDPAVPVADSIGELARLRDEGKILHIGVSNFAVADLDAAQAVAPIVAVQNQYSPGHREPESDGVLTATAERGLAFLPWRPLGGLGGARGLPERFAVLGEIGRRRGVSPHRVALAWLLGKGPQVFPIPGASRRETLEDSAASAELDLLDEIESIDAALSRDI
jgi:aryl-alcohol dehydrogenase-like predicted oxidoreductase